MRNVFILLTLILINHIVSAQSAAHYAAMAAHNNAMAAHNNAMGNVGLAAHYQAQAQFNLSMMATHQEFMRSCNNSPGRPTTTSSSISRAITTEQMNSYFAQKRIILAKSVDPGIITDPDLIKDQQIAARLLYLRVNQKIRDYNKQLSDSDAGPTPKDDITTSAQVDSYELLAARRNSLKF